MRDFDQDLSQTPAVPQEHAWVAMQSIPEIEGWMEVHNQELQQLIGSKAAHGQGICFRLIHGGELYLHTNSEGDILLDVTPEAAWVAPVISAATRAVAPRGQVWLLRSDVLVELLVGLNSLIAATRLVLRHEFGMRK